MNQTTVRDWWDRFQQQVRESAQAVPLKEASLSGNLTEWTRLTTEAVVRSCSSFGWETTARGHRLDRLPEVASEYLAIDAMAFPSRDGSGSRWPLPVAVFELENSPNNDRVAYSLWKVLCVRAPLRMVFAYRRDWDQARQLMSDLAEVVSGFSPSQRIAFDGDTAVVNGSRDESETFPHGYFKLWVLDTNLARFDRI